MMPTATQDTMMSAKRIRSCLSNNLLLFTTIAGVLVGGCLGILMKPCDLHEDTILLISYPGELFMRLLKLMILPLIIASLISGCARLNASMNGSIAVRTIVYFLTTSLLNAVLGAFLALLIHPGDPTTKMDDLMTSEVALDEREPHILDGILDLGRNLFPDNIFRASFQQAHTVYSQKVVNATTEKSIRTLEYRDGTNTLGIIFFCLVFGTVLGAMGKQAKIVVEFFSTIDQVVMKMVTGVMWFTPVGISSVICGKILSVANLGRVIQQLSWFITTVTLGVFIYQLFVLQLIYFVFVRRNPYKYYWRLIQATVTAFATASSAATLPVTFRCLDTKSHVDPRISRFVLPVGCAINMDGTALFVAVASVFIAQMNQVPLGAGEILTVILASTAASFSSASIPSAALVLIFMVLATIDVPSHDVTLLFAIDWFVDRIRTTNNMLGDCYAAAVVQQLSRDQLGSSDSDVIKCLSSNGHWTGLAPGSTEPPALEAGASTIIELTPTSASNGGFKPCV